MIFTPEAEIAVLEDLSRALWARKVQSTVVRDPGYSHDYSLKIAGSPTRLHANPSGWYEWYLKRRGETVWIPLDPAGLAADVVVYHLNT